MIFDDLDFDAVDFDDIDFDDIDLDDIDFDDLDFGDLDPGPAWAWENTAGKYRVPVQSAKGLDSFSEARASPMCSVSPAKATDSSPNTE